MLLEYNASSLINVTFKMFDKLFIYFASNEEKFSQDVVEKCLKPN